MPDETPHVAIVGAAFSGNKGAASMLVAVIQHIRRNHPHAEISVLTTYPEADRKYADSVDEVLGLTPTRLAAIAFPLSVLTAFGSLARVPRRLIARTPELRSLLRADVVIDLAGISFMSGRGIPTLGYNVLMTGLPIALGRPVIKGSQAIGPFDSIGVRLSARAILPRVHQVVARGETTRSHLDALGLGNVVSAPDLAFLLASSPAELERAAELLPQASAKTIGVIPSQVVDTYSGKHGGTYIDDMVMLVDGLQSRGHEVVLIPHAIRPGRPAGKMNDLPLSTDIASRLDPQPIVIETDESPGTLRALISRCDLVLTSRFHGMISALATGTPTVVVGWSHKYREVLAQFGQSDAVVDYRDLRVSDLLGMCDNLIEDEEARRNEIRKHLPAVVAEAESGLAAMSEFLK